MKTLPYDKAKIEEIVKTYPTPFHIYDEAGIVSAAQRLQRAFQWNAGYKEYYAVKACPNPAILRLLHRQGCGMDCSSYTELMLCERLGIVGEDIMFSSNDTPAEEFVYARRLGALINLDDYSHIDFLKENGGIPKTICLRYNPGGEFRLGNTIMGNPGDAKYGMTREQIFAGVRKLREYGAERFGLHAFLASNTTDNAYYPSLAAELFQLAADLHRELSVEIAFVNLSGGVGIPYRPEEEPADILAIGQGVREAYERILVPAGMDHVAIKTELGRYMTGPYGSLVARVLHIKDTYKQYVGLDACAANLMRPAMYGAYHHITVLGKENEPCDHVYDVTGSLCENNDKFAVDRKLPKIEVGDLVAIHDTGAHGFAMGYNYNGKLRSAELLLHANGEVELIRRAETPKDYFATLDFTGLF
ncbi:MAG: diaminopimelate decarboxylase [Candidatus Spyradocola sp.]